MPNTLYPTQVDSWSDPVSTTGLADAGYEHDIAHDRLNDSVIALETNVGIHLSPVTSTIDYILRNHQHSGADSSAILASLSARPVTDGTVLNLQTAAGVSVIQALSTSAGPTLQVTPPSTTTVGQVIKQQASASADFLQFQNSVGTVIAKVNSNGGIVTSAGLTLLKSAGGTSYLSCTPSAGEIDFVNGAMLKGFSGANGTGQQYQMNMATGQLFLGANSGTPSLVINNWNSTRSSSLQIIGKNNADSGLTSFAVAADADGQIFTPRSMVVQGNLAKPATGLYIGTDNFLAFSYPTYDGVTTYTKAAGVSLQPGVNPPLTAGTFSIAGALSTTGNATVGGSLSVTGSLTATSATTSLSTLSVSGTATIGTLNVTGTTTLGVTTLGTTSLGNNKITNLAAGTLSTDAVNFSQLTAASLPPGMMVDFAGFVAPTGWVLCNAAALSRTTFSALFAAITISTTGNTTSGSNIITAIPSTANMTAGMPLSGTNIPGSTTITSVDSASQIHISNNASASTTGGAFVVAPFGVGDGSTTFNVPDSRSRVTIGAGTGTGLSARNLGATGGEETHVLVLTEMTVHNHGTANDSHGHGINYGGAGNGGFVEQPDTNSTQGLQVSPSGVKAQGNPLSIQAQASGLTINNAGGSAGVTQGHNNVQPFIVCTKIIKT